MTTDANDGFLQTLCVGGETTIDFDFTIYAAADLQVLETDSGGVITELVLDTDYSVPAGSVGLNDPEGGTITLLAGPYPTGATAGNRFSCISNASEKRVTDFQQGGDFFAATLNQQLDYQTLLLQQHRRDLDKCVRVSLDSTVTDIFLQDAPEDGYGIVWDGADGLFRNTTVSLATLETQAAALFAIASDISTVAGISAAVTTVSGIHANVTTVAGISANVTTVAGISGNVTTVAGISGNVTTVAGISASVTTVAGISSAVSIVAGISSAVSTVSGISAAVSTVSGIASAVSNVSSISAAVSTVSGISGNVTTVAGISANVTTVAGNSANVTTVAGISANVTTVAGISTAISTCATNITAIQNAPTYATNASNSATAAAGSASAAATSEANAAASAAQASSYAAGVSLKQSVTVATTAALTGTYANGASGVGATFTYTATGVDTIDGHALVLGDSVLLKDQAAPAQNGIYTVTLAGAGGIAGILTRRTDYDTSAEVTEGTAVIVEEGTANTGHLWIMTHSGTITMGTTAIDWTQLVVAASTTTGDVVVSGSTATIQPAAVTLAKMADLAQDQFIIRTTASTGVPQTATCTAAARTVLDDTTVAAMLTTLGGQTKIGGGTAGGTANAQTLTPTPALGAYAADVQHTFLPVATNTSGTVTINVSGLGTRNIKKFIGGAVVLLAVGDLVINQPAQIVDDGTQYILMDPNTFTQGADVASATTTNLDTATGNYVHITGTTTITGITLAQGRQCTVVFDGALTFTNGASLLLPASANITTAAGDVAVLRGEASGVVRCIEYNKKDGTAIVGTSAPNSSYRTLHQVAGTIQAGLVAGTYSFRSDNSTTVVSGGNGGNGPASIYLATADYPTVGGVTTKLRIQAQCYTNDVAPTGNYTFGLYPFTRPGTSGGAGATIITIGTVVSGSNGATFTTPAADGLLNAVGSDFAFPTDGHYLIGLVTTATLAASSQVGLNAYLQYRNA